VVSAFESEQPVVALDVQRRQRGLGANTHEAGVVNEYGDGG
jgi:hypothetical protein